MLASTQFGSSLPVSSLETLPAFQLGLGAAYDASYFEGRLLDGQPQIDHLVAFSRGAAQVVARTLSSARRSLGLDPAWHTLVALFERWSDGRSPLSLDVPAIWLEFDDVHPCRGVSLPSVSVCLVQGYRPDSHLEQGDRGRSLKIMFDALDVLGGDSTLPVRAALARAVDGLPAGGRFIHLSMMLGRQPQSIKLYGVLPRADLRPYLEAQEFGGPVDTLDAILSELYPEALLGQQVFIDLNFDTFRDRGRASLGLAVAQQHTLCGPGADPGRASLLSRWAQKGLCGERQRQRLDAWMQRAISGQDQDRFLDLKLVWQAAQGITPKAYLGCWSALAEREAFALLAGSDHAVVEVGARTSQSRAGLS